MHKVSVELIFTGNELLIGKTLNTNSQWLAKRIYSLGAEVSRMMSVSDTLEAISGSLLEAIGRHPDMVITSGGLGPTFDDMTLEAVAKATERPLVLNQDVLDALKLIYKRRWEKGISKEKELSEYKQKMAQLPEGSVPLPNNVGSAPGVLLELEEGVKIICLPGVPAELKSIFNQSVVDIIEKMVGDIEIAEARFKVEQFIESEMAPLIDKVMKAFTSPPVYIKSHPLGWEDTARVEFHLTSKGEKTEHVKENIEKATAMLKKLVASGGGKIIEEND